MMVIRLMARAGPIRMRVHLRNLSEAHTLLPREETNRLAQEEALALRLSPNLVEAAGLRRLAPVIMLVLPLNQRVSPPR